MNSYQSVIRKFIKNIVHQQVPIFIHILIIKLDRDRELMKIHITSLVMHKGPTTETPVPLTPGNYSSSWRRTDMTHVFLEMFLRHNLQRLGIISNQQEQRLGVQSSSNER